MFVYVLNRSNILKQWIYYISQFLATGLFLYRFWKQKTSGLLM